MCTIDRLVHLQREPGERERIGVSGGVHGIAYCRPVHVQPGRVEDEVERFGHPLQRLRGRDKDTPEAFNLA